MQGCKHRQSHHLDEPQKVSRPHVRCTAALRATWRALHLMRWCHWREVPVRSLARPGMAAAYRGRVSCRSLGGRPGRIAPNPPQGAVMEQLRPWLVQILRQRQEGQVSSADHEPDKGCPPASLLWRPVVAIKADAKFPHIIEQATWLGPLEGATYEAPQTGVRTGAQLAACKPRSVQGLQCPAGALDGCQERLRLKGAHDICAMQACCRGQEGDLLPRLQSGPEAYPHREPVRSAHCEGRAGLCAVRAALVAPP
mmetsp:Transcript_111104/g.237448  ORF Transcript_111104/g.237448 Transcript_111104/m.237448 type:complete len:254 (+) Transcript_111104:266-1027(+)